MDKAVVYSPTETSNIPLPRKNYRICPEIQSLSDLPQNFQLFKDNGVFRKQKEHVRTVALLPYLANRFRILQRGQDKSFSL
jgi:hypothetical protein